MAEVLLEGIVYRNVAFSPSLRVVSGQAGSVKEVRQIGISPLSPKDDVRARQALDVKPQIVRARHSGELVVLTGVATYPDRVATGASELKTWDFRSF